MLYFHETRARVSIQTFPTVFCIELGLLTEDACCNRRILTAAKIFDSTQGCPTGGCVEDDPEVLDQYKNGGERKIAVGMSFEYTYDNVIYAKYGKICAGDETETGWPGSLSNYPSATGMYPCVNGSGIRDQWPSCVKEQDKRLCGECALFYMYSMLAACTYSVVAPNLHRVLY